MIQKKYWKELAAFSILLFIGFALSVLMALGVQIPYVADIITRFFKMILPIKS